MRSRFGSCLLLVASAVIPQTLHAQKKATYWLTTPDKSSLLQLQQTPLNFTEHSGSNPTISVDDQQTFQTMDGFGFALTGGSAQLIMHMDPAKRAALLQELFTDSGNNIGVSYLRVSIGSSDMNDHVYSYDDLPEGQTDPDMAKFSLAPDQKDVIPALKLILAINPKIKILGSPWSAPLWMKTTGVAKGGVLNPEYFAAYATYFVKYIQGMKPYKKMSNTSAVVTITPPEGWDKIVAFAKLPSGTGHVEERLKARPDQDTINRAFAGLLENIKLKNCHVNPGYLKALGMKSVSVN